MRSEVDLRRASLAVKAVAVKLGIHRELELDSVLTVPYTEDEILRIENFAEELATEKITGQFYTMGVPYEDARIKSSVYAMATEPIAYSLLALDKLRKRADEKTVKHRALFTQHYLNPARTLLIRLWERMSSSAVWRISRPTNLPKPGRWKNRVMRRRA